MTQSAEGYVARAAECARLANLTQDEMIQAVLLRQRQEYLKIAQKLGIPMNDAITNAAPGKKT